MVILLKSLFPLSSTLYLNILFYFINFRQINECAFYLCAIIILIKS